MKNLTITKEDVYEIKKQKETNVEPSHDNETRKSHTKDIEFSNTELNDMNDLNDIELKNMNIFILYIFI